MKRWVPVILQRRWCVHGISDLTVGHLCVSYQLFMIASGIFGMHFGIAIHTKECSGANL